MDQYIPFRCASYSISQSTLFLLPNKHSYTSISSPLSHLGHAPLLFPGVPSGSWTTCETRMFFLDFPPYSTLPSVLLSIPKPHFPSIIYILPYPFTSFIICSVLPAMFPYCLSIPILCPKLLSIFFSSLPLLQILRDSHSPPGLNHQDPLARPNHGSVSPQRGFCLLTVETHDLHALCLWSVPQHLEAVEVITVICSTRRATVHSQSPPPPSVKAALFKPSPQLSCSLEYLGAPPPPPPKTLAKRHKPKTGKLTKG